MEKRINFVATMNMKKVTLIFPNTFKLAEFILNEHPSGAEVNSFNHSLTSKLTDEQIAKACTTYGAVMQGKIIIVGED